MRRTLLALLSGIGVFVVLDNVIATVFGIATWPTLRYFAISRADPAYQLVEFYLPFAAAWFLSGMIVGSQLTEHGWLLGLATAAIYQLTLLEQHLANISVSTSISSGTLDPLDHALAVLLPITPVLISFVLSALGASVGEQIACRYSKARRDTAAG